MRVHWWRVPRDEVPTVPDEVTSWLDTEWDRVARWVAPTGP
jgi:hypothetical protein